MSYCQLFMLYLVITCNCDITQQSTISGLRSWRAPLKAAHCTRGIFSFAARAVSRWSNLIIKSSRLVFTLHEMVCIRTLPRVVHSQYIYWYKANIRMRQDV